MISRVQQLVLARERSFVTLEQAAGRLVTMRLDPHDLYNQIVSSDAGKYLNGFSPRRGYRVGIENLRIDDRDVDPDTDCESIRITGSFVVEKVAAGMVNGIHRPATAITYEVDVRRVRPAPAPRPAIIW